MVDDSTSPEPGPTEPARTDAPAGADSENQAESADPKAPPKAGTPLVSEESPGEKAPRPDSPFPAPPLADLVALTVLIILGTASVLLVVIQGDLHAEEFYFVSLGLGLILAGAILAAMGELGEVRVPAGKHPLFLYGLLGTLGAVLVVVGLLFGNFLVPGVFRALPVAYYVLLSTTALVSLQCGLVALRRFSTAPWPSTRESPAGGSREE